MRLYRINYFQIVLIPNMIHHPKWEDCRHTALLNNFFKIISKILANRLYTVLHVLNVDYQSSFIANRNILKGVTIIQEVGHKCKKTNYDRYMLEFDFEMSSDMVN